MDPSAYLKSRTSGSVTVASKFGKVEKFAQVVHAMRAQLDEEIDLVEGQTVRITEVIDKDWWRGEVDGRSGDLHHFILFTFSLTASLKQLKQHLTVSLFLCSSKGDA